MENKLELKHLAPYLPYGVQFLLSNPFYNQIGTLKAVGLHPYEGKGNRISIFVDLPVESGRQIILPKEPTATNSIYKLLLIPLSELTEEQWIEVFKSGLLSTQVATFDISIYFNQVLMKFIASGHCLRFEYTTLTFSTGNYPFNQLAAFNKLFELHADVYGLLEAGLALNKLEHGK